MDKTICVINILLCVPFLDLDFDFGSLSSTISNYSQLSCLWGSMLHAHQYLFVLILFCTLVILITVGGVTLGNVTKKIKSLKERSSSFLFREFFSDLYF